MSIENAKAFIERMKIDADFRKEVGEKSSSDERREYVTESGFNFTNEELESVRSKLPLSDEELNGLSAGSIFGCYLNAVN